LFRELGYDVDDDELEQFTWKDYDEYEDKRDSCLRRIRRTNRSIRGTFSGIYKQDGKKTYVSFIRELESTSKISTKSIKEIVAFAVEMKMRKVFIISSQKPNSDSLKYTAEMKIQFEVYTETEMAVDRSNHVLNPVFVPLNDKEKEEFLTESGILPGRMPCFAKWSQSQASTSEPLLQYGRYPMGTVVKIYRENNYTEQVASESVYWRIVT